MIFIYAILLAALCPVVLSASRLSGRRRQLPAHAVFEIMDTL